MRLEKKKKKHSTEAKAKGKQKSLFLPKVFSPQGKAWGRGFFLEGCMGLRAERGWGTQPGRPPWPSSGLPLAQRPPQWENRRSPLSSGKEEGTCCGGMNVPGEPSFSTLVLGDGGAFENTPALPDFTCVCVL